MCVFFAKNTWEIRVERWYQPFERKVLLQWICDEIGFLPQRIVEDWTRQIHWILTSIRSFLYESQIQAVS